jgi:hypothetical protein
MTMKEETEKHNHLVLEKGICTLYELVHAGLYGQTQHENKPFGVRERMSMLVGEHQTLEMQKKRRSLTCLH